MKLRLGASVFVITSGLIAGVLTYRIAISAEPMFPLLGESSAAVATASVANPAGEITSKTPAQNRLSDSATSTLDELQLVVAGFASPFVNGSEIPVAGDLVA